jgi:uncharacterized membrane protein YfcA
MQLEALDLILIFLAGIAGGAINALAGGGTLITFPLLTFVGIPPVSANVTNTVALVPGYVGGMLGQASDLKGQRRRLLILIPAGALGGLAGGLLLLATSERLFRELVPYLILVASGLLAIQEPVKQWLARRNAAQGNTQISEFWIVFPIFLAAVYGGYFGAGLSVILLAVMGLVIDDSLTRINALKQAVAFAANMTAALLFVFSGQVIWLAAGVMAVGALGGGALGGRLAGRIKPVTLRTTVVIIGVTVAIIYLIRG